MKVRYTLPALADLEAILDYVSERAPQGARRIEARIQAIERLLAPHPLSGAPTRLPGQEAGGGRLPAIGRTRYDRPMTNIKTRAMPAPLPPTEAELAAWNALTREEQIARYRDYFSHPDCDRISDATMSDIRARARDRVAARRRG